MGVSYEIVFGKSKRSPARLFAVRPSHFVLQCLNYLEYIDNYHERIRMFHVKDAEFNPTENRAFMALSILDRPCRKIPFAGRRAG